MNAKSDSSVAYGDAVTICEWMEPRPTEKWYAGYQPFDPTAPPCPWKWWFWDGMANIYGGYSMPIQLTLDRLYEVEERLTDGQWLYYGTLCWKWYTEAATSNDYEISALNRWRKALLHLSAQEKAKALAEVIRYTEPHETNPDGNRG